MLDETRFPEGWGPVTVKDKRLKGWRLKPLIAPLGSIAVIDACKKGIVQNGPFREKAMWVRFRLTWPTGEEFTETQILRADTVEQLSRLDEAVAYFDRVTGGAVTTIEQRVQFEDDAFAGVMNSAGDRPTTFKAAGGPPLNWGELLVLLDAVEIWRNPADQAAILPPVHGPAAELIALTAEQIRAIMERAYLAGRCIREAEFPADRGRSQAIEAAVERTSKAEAWWPAGQDWAQELIDDWPANAGRVSRNKLSQKMADHWSERPFQPEGPAQVDANDLYTRVFRKWTLFFPDK